MVEKELSLKMQQDSEIFVIYKTMKNYKIQVWYRYYASGEQEQEFEIFDIISDTAENAVKQALSNFQSNNQIPFKTEILTKN